MIKEKKKECIAMLLAGGRGSRLKALTNDLAKPAVTFGGKYKIIDFTLTNCVHSGIDTVGVLTQYEPHLLHNYIGKGQHWDLDRLSGGVSILPPFSKSGSAAWYSGTANAVYQNRLYIDSYSPKYVMVLSGDHVYKMDYSKMLDYHKEMCADCTIAVIEVPKEDANQFGIMNTDKQNKITDFEEKPKQPKSNLASMGIYIFNWQTLREYLEADENDPKSSNDFGKNVIPSMLGDGLGMYAYRFKGYWKDVGTIDSLWQANMDLLEDMTLGMPDWQILSRSAAKPPQFIGTSGSVKNSLVTEGCEIYGDVEHSILSSGVIVEPGATVRDCVIMANSVIKRGATIQNAIMDEGAVILEDTFVGGDRAKGVPITVVARYTTIGTRREVLRELTTADRVTV